MAPPPVGQAVGQARLLPRRVGARQSQQAPGGAKCDQSRDGDGEERELQRRRVLGATRLRGEWRDQGKDRDNDGHHQAEGAPGRREPAGPPLGSPFTHLVERRLVGRRTKKPQMHTTARVPTGIAKVRAWVLARSAIIGCLLRAQLTESLFRAQMT